MSTTTPGDFAEARESVACNGGLVSQADLAKRWGLTRQRVNQLVRSTGDFPDPVGVVNGHEVWLFDEADRWMRWRRAEADAIKWAPRLERYLRTQPFDEIPHWLYGVARDMRSRPPVSYDH